MLGDFRGWIAKYNFLNFFIIYISNKILISKVIDSSRDMARVILKLVGFEEVKSLS